jgi:ATP-dependent Clp protease ATP-binding subunit ClpA
MNPFKWFWEGLTTPMSSESENLGNFTPRACQVLALARKEADRFNHNFVGTEHLLLGLIKLGQGTAVNVLTNMGLELETVRLEVEKQVGTGPDQKMVGNIPYTPRVKKVLALAAQEAKALNHTYVGTEAILLGLLREGDGVAARVLTYLGVNIETTRQNILKELDPNYEPGALSTLPPKPVLPKTGSDTIELSKRYDVYCREGNQEMVYRNVLFKGTKRLFPKDRFEVSGYFIELEEPDGQTVFVAKYSVMKFREHVGPGNPT